MHRKAPNIANGFVLLEVLLATSLILGAWMASIGAYQGLALRFHQQESKRSNLRQIFDDYEIAEQVRADRTQSMFSHISHVSNVSSGGIQHESSRVSRRNRTLHSITQPTTKN